MLYDPKWEVKIDPYKLDPTTKFRWTTALRSGEYEKTNGEFEYKGAFCALGVLCKVVGVPTNNGIGANYNGLLEAVPTLGRKLPGELWAQYERVYSVNDRSDSFEPVADWIEANL